MHSDSFMENVGRGLQDASNFALSMVEEYDY